MKMRGFDSGLVKSSHLHILKSSLQNWFFNASVGYTCSRLSGVKTW